MSLTHTQDVPPTTFSISLFKTVSNSYGFIRILRSVCGHTDTTRHYTKARFRPQAQDMLLVDLVAVSVRPKETFL